MSIVLKGVEGAMRGYRPQVDWGGEEGPATIKVGSHNVRVGTAGWRRRCLFTLLSALLLLSILNIILTLWLLRRIMLGTEGVGSLKILRGGVELDGISRMDHGLTVAQIQGQTSEDLKIMGFYNISLALMDGKNILSDLVLDTSGLRSRSRGFRVKSPQGSLLFETKDRHLATDAQFFTVTGNEGADFLGSLGTPRIDGGDVHEFRLESSTRSVIGSAGNLVRIEARDGDVTVTSIGDVEMTSSSGKFRFESPNVFFSNLLSSEDMESVAPTTPATETQISAPEEGLMKDSPYEESRSSSGAVPSEEEAVQIFQVCVCPSGMLFLVASEYLCIPDKWTCK